MSNQGPHTHDVILRLLGIEEADVPRLTQDDDGRFELVSYDDFYGVIEGDYSYDEPSRALANPQSIPNQPYGVAPAAPSSFPSHAPSYDSSNDWYGGPDAPGRNVPLNSCVEYYDDGREGMSGLLILLIIIFGAFIAIAFYNAFMQVL